MAKKPAVKACSNCGSAELEWIGGGANAVFDFTGASGLSGLLHCANCGRDVLPIEFQSEKARKKFAASLKKNKGTAPKIPEVKKKKAGGPGIDLAAGLLSTRLIGLTLIFIVLSVIFLLVAVSQRSSGGLTCAAGICGVTVILIFLSVVYFFSARKRE